MTRNRLWDCCFELRMTKKRCKEIPALRGNDKKGVGMKRVGG